VNVSDSESGIPLANTRISLKGPSPRDVVTNAGGLFEAKRLTAGTYTVTAVKPGYTSSTAEIDLDEEAHESAHLSLRALPGTVAGRVTESDSRLPVQGAHVYLDSNRIDRSTLTGKDGEYSLNDIPAGPYTICLEAEGLTSVAKLVDVKPGIAIPVDLSTKTAAQQ
jgi:hypothetical protein